MYAPAGGGNHAGKRMIRFNYLAGICFSKR
jgi:hypothetical protein